MADLQPNPQPISVNNSPPKKRMRIRSRRKPRVARSKFILDSSNCQKLFAQNKILQSTLKNKNLCHKFIIQNSPLLSKKMILQAFTDQVLPNLIIPMNIEVANNKNVIFYCTNCVPAIEKLIKDNLIITLSRKVNKVKEHYQLNVTLVVAALLTQPSTATQVLKSMLGQRVSTEKPVTAHLDRLTKLPGWYNKIFLNLNAHLGPNVLLSCVKDKKPKILELQDNNIETLRGWCNYYEVDAVNLAYNQIKSFEDLGPLLKMDLKRINLQENPIRKQFRDQESFNNKLRELFPNALIIETVSRSRTTKLPSEKNQDQQDFMSEEAVYLVDQFMEHYFSFYDNPRTKRYLEDIYHKDAIFSLTSTILDEPGGLCQVSERFKHHAHNLLDDKSKKDFVTGPAEIIRKICYLPNVEHDHVSFHVDIPYYIENDIILFNIAGAFRQGRIYMFHRAFLLKAARNGEYQIMNDFLHVTNKLTDTQLFDDTNALKLDLNIGEKLPFIAQNNAQKDGMTVVFIEITRLHVQYARDILEKGHWNMKKALELYVYDMRYDNIPPNYFMQEEIKHIVFSCLPAIKMGMNVNKVSRVLENMKYLTEEKYLLQLGEHHKILNKCKKDEIRKLLQK